MMVGIAYRWSGHKYCFTVNVAIELFLDMDLRCHYAVSVTTCLFMHDILVPRSLHDMVRVVLDERTFYSSRYTIWLLCSLGLR